MATYSKKIDAKENVSYLASKYNNLYNNVDDKCNLSIMEESLTRKFSIERENDVSRITRDIIKRAS